MGLDNVRRRLKEQGLKLTPQRLEILKILMDAIQPLTAQEISQAVRILHPNVSLDTIYRNLTLLTECGLINQINLQNRMSARFEFQRENKHHHHFVCRQCGKSFCMDACPTPPVAKPAEDPGFKVVGHAYEVYGYCTDCQAV